MAEKRHDQNQNEQILVRPDALPEHTHYRDDGCEVSPSCLRCPLPRCRYDEPGGIRSILAEYRDREIVRLRTEGWKVEDLAAHFQVSRRSIFRILKRHATPLHGPPRAEDLPGPDTRGRRTA
jgi:hypothetical protein